MSSYDRFAAYYDALTDDVQYARRAAYLRDLLSRFGVRDGLVLDLACGTGSMTIEMAGHGYDMIGVDASAGMLSVAQQKATDAGCNILFLCQRMQQLDLYGTVRGTICTLDSLNHLTDEADLRETVRRVSLFTEPGGVFVFDVNTPYKHRAVLANNSFVRESDDVFCVWQSEISGSDTVRITLDFFERDEDKDVYYRSTEQFCERSYDLQLLREVLETYGFEVSGVFDEFAPTEPAADAQRIVIAAIKGDYHG
ncbi:MAG: methyltransferase domain-containing protein [Clostridia bacterium]|nr:methyltransferase domain-containing protein [Clostridia bacterium]